MKNILFLLLIYPINIYANDTDNKGCTISFFKKETPCSPEIEKKKITIAPIVIERAPQKNSTSSKNMELKLRKILNDLTEYKNENNMKINQLREELTAMKKELQKVNYNKKKLVQKLKKVEKKLSLSNKKINHTKKALIETQNKLKKKNIIVENIIINNIEKETPNIHKVIHKMAPSLMRIYDTPWIEITVEDHINIYQLALKYYGDREAYKKIYAANKNVIHDDLKIDNGMSLIIPMTGTFKEQPILLNRY